MEDTSVMFAVDSGQCSEDEDDELQRKEELHQLLSEQLADDLLDDTLSSSQDEGLSVLSTPQHSNSPSPGTPQVDVTQNALPSHESHMTSADHLTQSSNLSLSPGQQLPNSQTNNELNSDDFSGFQAHLQNVPDMLTKSPFKLKPPLPLDSNTSDVFAGTSQAYSNRSLALPTSMEPTMSNGDHSKLNRQHQQALPLSQDAVIQSCDLQGRPHNFVVHSQSNISNYSDNFPMISSSARPLNISQGNEHFLAQHNDHVPNYALTNVTSNITNGVTTEHYLDARQAPLSHPTPSTASQITPTPVTTLTQLTLAPGRLEQLEILYHARGRQVNQLTQQLATSTDDSERHICVLRHEKLLVESERNELAARLEQLENAYQAMEETMATTQGELAAERIKCLALENNKMELVCKLQAAETTVSSLTKQVTELSSSDTLSRIRDNYNQALNTAAHEHKEQLLDIQQEADHYRQQLEDKEILISQLKQQLESQPTLQPSHRESHPHKLHGSTDQSIVQQLEYSYKPCEGCERCDGCEGERVVELVGQTEDLVFQLSITREELEQALKRAELSETELHGCSVRLGELEEVNETLSGQVILLQKQLEEIKVQSEVEKKAALEHCRSACLKLHEDSTQRLKETVTTERQKLTQDSDTLMAKLKAELATVQEQYVAVCVDKDTVVTELATLKSEQQVLVDKARNEWSKGQEAAIEEALGVAKTEWEELFRQRVETALKEQEEVRKRSESSQNQLPDPNNVKTSKSLPVGEEATTKASQESAVREAVRLARLEWLKEKESSLTGRVESAVSAAQRLWREQHLQELDTLKKRYERDERSTLTKQEIEAAVIKTKQECERQCEVRLREALVSERAQWNTESHQKWAEREAALIATAHAQWSIAQETVLAAEVERSKKEWEESQKQKTQTTVQEALLRAKQHYEGVVKRITSDLSRKYEAQKSSMAAEIRQLETKLATILRSQEGTKEQDKAPAPVGSQGNSEALKRLLENTAGDLRKDVLMLLTGELEKVRRLHYEEIATTRQTTAHQVKHYYLHCLRQLVNSRSHDLESQSRDTDNESVLKSHKKLTKELHQSSQRCQSEAQHSLVDHTKDYTTSHPTSGNKSISKPSTKHKASVNSSVKVVTKDSSSDTRTRPPTNNTKPSVTKQAERKRSVVQSQRGEGLKSSPGSRDGR